MIIKKILTYSTEICTACDGVIMANYPHECYITPPTPLLPPVKHGGGIYSLCPTCDKYTTTEFWGSKSICKDCGVSKW